MVAKKVVVSEKDRVVLERIVRARTCERRMLERAHKLCSLLAGSLGASDCATGGVLGEACEALALAV